MPISLFQGFCSFALLYSRDDKNKWCLILKTLNVGRGKASSWLHVVKAGCKRKPDNAKDRICKHMKKLLSWNSLKFQCRRSVQTAFAKTTKGPQGKKTKQQNQTKREKQTEPHTHAKSKSSSYKQICCWKLSARPFWAEYLSFCRCPGQIARCSLSLTAVLTAEAQSCWSEQGCCVEFAPQIWYFPGRPT